MLPLHQAQEIKDSLKAYLRSSFDFQDPALRGSFEEFINHPEKGLFKGPYLSVKLPFVKASSEAMEAVPLEVKPDWPPYRHQILSWERLGTREKAPQPTLVTTGTGSGKTESFLYPILDYCLKEHQRPGIKCIIMYPMNALATDQAKRLAEIIHEDARLQGKVTAGLFIGDSSAPSLPTLMGEDHVIERRDAIVADPPDILLTNFKMLDYGLMQHRFAKLWEGNELQPDLLQFLVLDEMHTYDGAQGTDVANLIRRLKLKLDMPQGQLCPVGTSATLGSGEDASKELASFATTLFGEEVGVDAVITESRLSSQEYFGPPAELDDFLPRPTFLPKVNLARNADYAEHIEKLATMWQLDVKSLASGLRGLRIVHDLISCCAAAPEIHRLDRLVESLDLVNTSFRGTPAKRFSKEEKLLLVESLVALIGAAKEGGMPMLFVQVQMWVRELSGVRRVLSHQPKFVWRDEPIELGEAKHMPPWYCRECGISGWLSSKREHLNQLDPADGEGTDKFFKNHSSTHFLIASEVLSRQGAAESGYDTRDSFECHVNPSTLELFEDDLDGRIKLFGARKLDNKGKNDHVCPSCNSRNSLSIIGSRVATLGSITVSQALASDFDETLEKDRKVLAFTNSVQDAAHQAGFIEARNYRFTMRASIQRVLNQEGGELTLPELQAKFKDYWIKHADDQGTSDIAAYFNRFFPKDYIGRAEPEDYMRNGKYLPLFEQAFDERIAWEILNEFGFESLLGRTLEKTGCAGTWLDPELIQEACKAMSAWVESELSDGQLDKNDLPRFVAMLGHRMRSRGAVGHPLLKRFREGKFERGDLNWYQSKSHILHRFFGRNSRMPRMVIHKPHSAGMADTTFSTRSAATGSPNWFHAYFRKSFQLANAEPEFVNEFYRKLFEVCTAAGLFDEVSGASGENHALLGSALSVATGVDDFQCNRCGHVVHEGHTAGKVDIAGGACLTYRCTGTYEKQEREKEPNYYQLVYNRSRSPRVYAREHTGLLERKTREILERDFKNRTKFNAPNTMVATSTLEMGIDIGSLQVAFNTSVPPTPSNFLQRVGRAGRKSGTALIVNFATSRSHDQYYYAEPDEMMAGEVASPGCYLEAREILRRHYFAFCIDSWTSEDASEHRIPSLVRHLRLLDVSPAAPEFFMSRILTFASTNEAVLLDRFTRCYQGEVTETTLEELSAWVKSLDFQAFHRNIFVRLKEELQDLQKEKLGIAKRIKDERLGEGDDLYQELMLEQKSLGGMMTLINKRAVLEHLTNVGALPNYAFPETGVTLNARVFKQAGAMALRSPLNKEYVIVRSASQALRELVPGSAFYSQGHRLEIGGLNAHDLRGEGERYMRFCSNCDHHDESTTPLADSPCPKCGDMSWMESSSRHRVAHLTSVRSSTSSSKSRVADRHETRIGEAFAISRHFKFDRSEGAWGIQAASFGFEFVRETEVTEFNLGLDGSSNQADQIEINGTKYPTHGFITCKECGKSTPKKLYADREKEYHYAYCPHAGKAWSDANSSIFHELFLFRRVKTEALKVLVPVHDLTEGSTDLELFQAGLELGFKKYFKGNPQHLIVRPYHEFNPGTGRKDLYLVILDHVPGGTGYLGRLFDPEEFGKILKLAHQAMVECSCHLEGKDGCYRCVYSYGNQRIQEDLSRKRGIELFGAIVDRLDNWERLIDGLVPLTQSGRLEESELESKFVASVKRYAQLNEGWHFAEELVDTNVHYMLTTATGVTYHVQPQVELGVAQGFDRATRPDFLMTATIVPEDMELEREAIPQLAIYLDGYQFHASEQHPRFGGDILKREQLRLHHGYAVWTLTWDDLVRFEEELADVSSIEGADFLKQAFQARPTSEHVIKVAQATHSSLPQSFDLNNNMSRLMWWMSQPSLENCRQDLLRSLIGFQEKLFARSFDSREEALREYLEGEERAPERSLDVWVPLNLPSRNNAVFQLKLVANLEQRELEVAWKALDLNGPDKLDWEAFWTWYNVLQFFSWITPPGAPQSVTYEQNDANEGQLMAAEPPSDHEDSWLQDMLSFFKGFEREIQELWEQGYFETEDNETALTELMDASGEGIACASFIHPVKKEVYFPSTEEDRRVFEAHGFTVVQTTKQ
jgi:DEAD/DEAH box helicase domain-containing protein